MMALFLMVGNCDLGHLWSVPNAESIGFTGTFRFRRSIGAFHCHQGRFTERNRALTRPGSASAK